jgi:hypothetical protein
MQWFEYDEAEEQLEVLEAHLKQAQFDLVAYRDTLSPISITAIKNEIVRLDMYINDIKEILGEDIGESLESGKI